MSGDDDGRREEAHSLLQVGHKSPNCPKRQQATVKRIQIPIKTLRKLKDNEVFAKVSGIQVSTMIDLGADRSVIPEEMVTPDQFTGREIVFNGVAQGALQAKIVDVTFKIAGVEYKRETLALPGEQIFWTVALSFDVRNKGEIQHLLARMNSLLRRTPTTYLQGLWTAKFRERSQ